MTEHVTVAFLGLGHMGGPMATNLVAANHAVRGFDPVPAALSAAAAAGVAAFDTAVDAVAGADVVITMLPNGEQKRCYAEIPGGAARCSVHRQLHDLGRRRPRGACAGGVARHRPAGRARLGRGERRGRRDAGVHGGR